MHVNNTINQILDQLSSIISQLDDNEYSLSLPILNHQTIGKHARHIIEFFIELTNDKPFICYDDRKRDLNLENSVSYTLQSIEDLKIKIKQLDFNELKTFKQLLDCETITTSTSVGREMIYCIDHGIHHFAIIKIALKDALPHVHISNNFGVAYSTIKYQNK